MPGIRISSAEPEYPTVTAHVSSAYTMRWGYKAQLCPCGAPATHVAVDQDLLGNPLGNGRFGCQKHPQRPHVYGWDGWRLTRPAATNEK